MEVEEFVRSELAVSYPGPCCRMVDRWIERRRGFSSLARFGRDFSSDADVTAWLGEPGGIAVAVNRVLRACGIRRTTEPVAGDIGLVFAQNGRFCLAIRGADMWFSRDENGLIGAPLDHVWKSWRL